jgi:plasmid stabilization system protein ParE
MKPGYALSPQAAQDLIDIWSFIKGQSSSTMADHVEDTLRARIVFLSKNPGAGHSRRDLTSEDVKFFPVYSYLIVYRSGTTPLQIVSILHGHRDVEKLLKGRL